MAPSAVSPERQSGFDASALTTVYHDTLRFYLNGTRVVIDEIDPEATLLEYLRGIGLTGTKLCVYTLPPLSCFDQHNIAQLIHHM